MLVTLICKFLCFREDNEHEDADDMEPLEKDAVEPQDDADTILQKPVVNRQSIKMCIKRSMKRIDFINNSVQDVQEKYPYLNEADLVRNYYNF